jgi:hypothetical protein
LRGVAETRHAEAAQVRNDDAAALRRQFRRDIHIRVNAVGKAVQQDRNRAIRGALLIPGDIENTGTAADDTDDRRNQTSPMP